ncbi:MAG: HD domain-containing protein [Bacteroidia bacterium]
MKKALTHPIFKLVNQVSKELNSPSYVVGGYVRDYYLKRDSKDVDFVTMGNGIALAKRVHQLLGNSHLSIFKNFGTAQIKTDEWEFEFVGARKESYRRESRKPIVEDGTFLEDISRRDFTVNSMAISLEDESYGELIDPFNGLKDLKAKLLKTPLDADTTFSDDPLRMLRAARFACQLNFTIDEATFQAMKKNAKRLSIVSQERITDEFQGIMRAPKPSIGIDILFRTSLLKEFFADLDAMYGIETIDGLSHKDNFYHTLEVLDKLCLMSDNVWLRWAALMHDIAKPKTKRFVPNEGWTFHGHEDKGGRMVKGIFKRLKLPLNYKMKYVAKLVRLHLRPIALTKENITDSAIRRLIFEAGDDLEDLMTLCKCDITTKNKKKEERFLNNLKLVEKNIQEVEERDKIRNWQPPIDGNEIMSIFGIGAGKEIGLIKSALKEAILDGEIKNEYDAAKKFVIEKGTELGLSYSINE